MVKLILEIIELMEVAPGPEKLHGHKISKDIIKIVKITTLIVVIIDALQLCLLLLMIKKINRITQY